MTRYSMPILLAVGVLACVAFGGRHGDDLSIVDVFLWLLVFLIVSGAALWPRAGRGPARRTGNGACRLGCNCRQTPTAPGQASELSDLAKARHAAKAS